MFRVKTGTKEPATFVPVARMRISYGTVGSRVSDKTVTAFVRPLPLPQYLSRKSSEGRTVAVSRVLDSMKLFSMLICLAALVTLTIARTAEEWKSRVIYQVCYNIIPCVHFAAIHLYKYYCL